MARRGRFIGLAIPLLAAVAVGGYWLSDRRLNAPVLTVPESSLTVGQVRVRPDYEIVLPIHNESDGEIEIVDFTSACGCSDMAFAPSKMRLDPGETVEVRVRMDLTTIHSEVALLRVRPLEASIVPVLAGPFRAKITWRLRGEVLSDLWFAPHLPRLDDLIAGVDSTAGAVRVRSHVPLKACTASCDPEMASVQVRPGDDGMFHISISPNPGLPLGPFQFPLAVSASPMDGGSPVQGFVTVGGRVNADVQATPSSLLLAPGAAAATTAQSVVVSSRSGRKIVAVTASVQPEGRLLVERVGSGLTWEYRVERKDNRHEYAGFKVLFSALLEGDAEPSVATLEVYCQPKVE